MAELLWGGHPHTLVQNRVYALPPRRTFVFATVAIESSWDEASGFAALTGANTAPGVETLMPFIRSTGTGTRVIVKST